ncbi:MAG: hypothetical protein ACUVXJ_00240 [Phycisphaerae bacterium]
MTKRNNRRPTSGRKAPAKPRPPREQVPVSLPAERARNNERPLDTRPARRRDLLPAVRDWSRWALDGPFAAYLSMLLVGLGIGWQCAASQRIFAAAIGPDAETTAMVVVVALLTAAVGPWLPGRAIVGIARFVQRRGRRSRKADDDVIGSLLMLKVTRQRDRSLIWLSISVLACLAGAVSLATLLLMGPAARIYQHVLQHFFWTNLTLSGLEWLGTVLLIGPSWVLHGLLIATLANAAGHEEPAGQRPGLVAGIIAGPGVALLLSAKWVATTLSGAQGFMLGVLPLFVVAALAAKTSQRADKPTNVLPAAETAPELSGRTEGLIWVLLVVWGVAAVLVGTGWVTCREVSAQDQPSTHTQWGWYLLTLGIGAAVAWQHARHQTRSASGCGMAAWAAGVGSGAGAVLAAFCPGRLWSELLQLLLLGLTFGYALHYAELAWLARSGSETQGFAQLASAVLAGLAVGLIAGRWWVLQALGPVGMMTAGALVMMALGGIVQIYEEDRPARIRYERLTVVFASLTAAIILFPTATRQWDSWEADCVIRPLPTDLSWLATRELPSARRICLVGVDASSAARWAGLGKARVDIILCPGSDPSEEVPPRLRGRTRWLRASAFRALRLEHERYDLVYQQGQPAARTDGYAEYSIEWLHRLASLTMPDGEIVLDVPLQGMNPEAIGTIVATLQRAAGSPACWIVTSTAGQPTMRLKTIPTTLNPSAAADGTWIPAKAIVTRIQDPRIHSIQHDRLTPLLQKRDQSPTDNLIRWLESCRSNTVAQEALPRH